MDFQEKFLKSLSEIAKEKDHDLVLNFHWANTGQMMFQPKNKFYTTLWGSFAFNDNYMTLEFFQKDKASIKKPYVPFVADEEVQAILSLVREKL